MVRNPCEFVQSYKMWSWLLSNPHIKKMIVLFHTSYIESSRVNFFFNWELKVNIKLLKCGYDGRKRKKIILIFMRLKIVYEIDCFFICLMYLAKI